MDKFLTTYFEGSEVQCRENCPDSMDLKEEKVIQLKGNCIPKGLISIENLFDRRDSFIRQTEAQEETKSSRYEKVNIGSEKRS